MIRAALLLLAEVRVMQWAAIFDMDGVLVDSNAAHFAAFHRIGRELGQAWTDADLQQTFGMHNNQIFPLLLGRPIPHEEVQELAARKEAYYRELARESLQPIAGAVPLFWALRAAGWKTAIGSSGPGQNVRLAIDVLGIGDALDAVVTGDDILHGKPDPDVFLKCVDRLGVPANQCVVLEDAPQGVTAAHRAGIVALALTSSRPREMLAHAEWIVDALAEVTPEALADLVRAGRKTV